MFPFLLIFVMIAGAIILFFFFQFGTDIRVSSEKVNKVSVLKSIDQQLAAFSLPNNALNSNVDLGIKSKISVNCKITNSNSQTELVFDDKTLISQKLVVSPILLEAKSLQAWTLSWDYPFKVANFYYLIPSIGESKNTAISIITPATQNNEQKEFIKNFKFPLSTGSSQDKKIVFLLDPSNPLTFSNARVVKIDFTQDIGTRKVEVYEQGLKIIDASYLGDPLALAAAFSRTKEDYECIEKQAFLRLKDIVELYKEKINLLKQKYPLAECDYSGIENYLSELNSLTEGNINQNTFTRLEQANNQMRLTNCAPLYLP